MPNQITPSSSRPLASFAPPTSRSGNATRRIVDPTDIGPDGLPTQGNVLVPHQGDSDGDRIADAQNRLFLMFLYAFYGRLNVVENTFASLAPGNHADGLRVDQPPSGFPLAIGSAFDAANPQPAGRSAGVNARDDVPPPYALSIDETTWSFLTDLLELRISMAIYSPNADGVDASTTIIDEYALRALLMRAIIWYIDRECISLTGVQVAFIGRRVGEEVNAQYPCLPITDIRDIAAQLPLEGISDLDQADFDPYMFCAGEFFPVICGYRYLLFLVVLCLFVSAIFGFLFARLFGTLLPAIVLIMGDARVKFLMKVIFKILDALDAFEAYVLHVGVVIFGFLEFVIHYGN